MKPAVFLGDSREELRQFPSKARQRAGYQLDRVQRGIAPEDWAFRILYVATFEEAVYVLHCFQKKGQKTDRRDIALGVSRFKLLTRPDR